VSRHARTPSEAFAAVAVESDAAVELVKDDILAIDKLVRAAHMALLNGELARAVGFSYSIATMARAAATRLEVSQAARAAAARVVDPGREPGRARAVLLAS